MRRLICVIVASLVLLSARADALTIRDIVELTRAGLGDEVLLALIEVDPSVYPIDTETVKYLKDAGVSQRVIVAMVRSLRNPPPPMAPDPVIAQVAPVAPEPQVIVIDHQDSDRVREVPVAVPVYIPVVQRSRVPRHPDTHRRVDQFPSIEDRRIPTVDRRIPTEDRRILKDSSTKPDHAPKPVYWGPSGTLRPDAWKPK